MTHQLKDQPESSTSAVNLASEAEKKGQPMSRLARATRIGVFALASGLAAPVFFSTGCAAINTQIGRVTGSPREMAYDSYRAKDYLVAKRQMNVIPESQLTESDKELIAKIERGIQEKMRFFLEKTTHFEGGKSEMENNYVEVLEYYELAYDHIPSDSPIRSGVKKRIDDLKKLIVDLQKKYDEAEAMIKLFSGEEDLIKDSRYIKLAAAIYTMQKNGAQLNINNDRGLVDLCIQFAKHFSERGEESQAILYFEMAKRLNENVIPTKENKDLFASASVALKEHEREAEVTKLKGYLQEFVKLYTDKKNPNSERLLELAYEISEHPYKKDLKEDPALGDVEKVKLEGDRKKSEANRRAAANARAAARARQKKIDEEKAAAKERKLLEQLTATITEPENVVPAKKSQPELTGEDKAERVKKLLDDAEKLYPSEEAIDYYQEVLKIDPNNSVAKDRLGKIEALQRIKAQQEDK